MSSRKGTIEVIARGIVKNRSGCVLLCKNLKHGYFYLPGGHVELGEPASESLRREFLEETGLRVRVKNLVACEEHRFAQKGRSRHEINLVFHVELHSSTETVQALEKHLGFEWVPVNGLGKRDLRPASATRLCRLTAKTRSVDWLSLESGR